MTCVVSFCSSLTQNKLFPLHGSTGYIAEEEKKNLFSELCEMCKYIVWGQSTEFISVTAGGGCRGLSEVKNVRLC